MRLFLQFVITTLLVLPAMSGMGQVTTTAPDESGFGFTTSGAYSSDLPGQTFAVSATVVGVFDIGVFYRTRQAFLSDVEQSGGVNLSFVPFRNEWLGLRWNLGGRAAAELVERSPLKVRSELSEAAFEVNTGPAPVTCYGGLLFVERALSPARTVQSLLEVRRTLVFGDPVYTSVTAGIGIIQQLDYNFRLRVSPAVSMPLNELPAQVELQLGIFWGRK